jgi:hypothetical protein
MNLRNYKTSKATGCLRIMMMVTGQKMKLL